MQNRPSRSQWPRGLRCWSASARLLGLRVRIPPGACTFFCCECCQVKVSATSWSLVQRSPTDCGASLCDLETSWMRRPWPTGDCGTNVRKNYPTEMRRISPKSVKKHGKVLHRAPSHTGHISTNHWHLIVLLITFHINTRIANTDIQLMFIKDPANITKPKFHIIVFIAAIFILLIFKFLYIQFIQQYTFIGTDASHWARRFMAETCSRGKICAVLGI